MKSDKSATGDSRWEDRVLEFLDWIDWYRRCLEDVIDHRPVRGLDEAKHGYDRAMDELKRAFR